MDKNKIYTSAGTESEQCGSSLFTLVQKSAFYVPANIIHSSVIVLFSLKPDDKSSAFCNPIFSVYLVRSVGFFFNFKSVVSNLWFFPIL